MFLIQLLYYCIYNNKSRTFSFTCSSTCSCRLVVSACCIWPKKNQSIEEITNKRDKNLATTERKANWGPLKNYIRTETGLYRNCRMLWHILHEVDTELASWSILTPSSTDRSFSSLVLAEVLALVSAPITIVYKLEAPATYLTASMFKRALYLLLYFQLQLFCCCL